MKSSVMLILALACAQRTPAPHPATTTTASAQRIILPDNYAVSVEVASDDATREQGLMFRDHLADDRGMIFLFPQAGEYPFWMKNTLIPLDMIWMDAQHRIVHVARNVQPCKADPCASYPPNAQAVSVLELAAGVATKHHLADGNVLRFEGLDSVIVR
jgi:uncharacterized membrane protein (UPF0127 family)